MLREVEMPKVPRQMLEKGIKSLRKDMNPEVSIQVSRKSRKRYHFLMSVLGEHQSH